MKVPRWIQLQLTEKCNLNCSMCYERNSSAYKNNGAVLEISRIKEIIDECSPFTPHYELFGGEPLLYPNIEELLEYIKKKSSTVDIPTNGTLVPKKIQALLNNSVKNLWVSLDGPEDINNTQRGANSYQRAVEGIQTLFSLRRKMNQELPKIGVHCVVTPFNYTHIHELINDPYLFNYVDNYSFELQKYLTPEKYEEYVKIFNSGHNKEEPYYAKGYVQNLDEFSKMDFELLHSSLKKIEYTCNKNKKGFFTNPGKLDYDSIKNYFTANWEKISAFHKSCIFPFTYAEITAKGDVTLCHSFYDDVLGNIYHQNLLTIWNNKKAMEFRKSIRKKLLPICFACCSFFNTENNA